MYYYIVDPQSLSQKEFERVQNVLYSSLSEFRISGEIVRITGLRTIQQLVENAIAHEAKTIVVCGNDKTFHDTINAIGKREMVVGYIPLTDSTLGNIFGIKNLSQAIKTIAFRRIEEIDLGCINQTFFVSQLTFGENTETEIMFEIDEKYKASQKIINGVIVNTRPTTNKKIGNPTDGILDVILLPKISKWFELTHKQTLKNFEYEKAEASSLLHVKTLEILKPAGLPLKIGDQIVARTPAKITIITKMLKLIVGKERNF